MRYKVFDVVLLNNGNKATILEEVDKDHYKVEIVNNDGKTEGIIQITDNDIKDCIFKK